VVVGGAGGQDFGHVLNRPLPECCERVAQGFPEGGGGEVAGVNAWRMLRLKSGRRRELVRTAYTLHAEDDDWGQAGTPVLQRAFEYWRNVDKDLGQRIENGVRAGQSPVARDRFNFLP
jgi:hypothetical protein